MSQLQQFSNNAATTLANSISSSSTTMTVASGTGTLFPFISGPQFFAVTIISSTGQLEVVKVTDVSSDTFTIVRGYDNTIPTSFTIGSAVELRPSAASFDNIYSQILTGNNTISGGTTFTGANNHSGSETFTGTTDLTGTTNLSGTTNISGPLTITDLAAPLTLSGGDKGVTPAVGTNDTTLATAAFVAAFPVPVDNSSASSDITLEVGQSCYFNVSSATAVPLHVATDVNQIYEISLQGSIQVSTSSSCYLQPNNTDIGNNLTYNFGFVYSGSSISQSATYQNNFYIGLNEGDVSYSLIRAHTRTAQKFIIYQTMFETPYSQNRKSTWLSTASSHTAYDTTTLWTSLGTLNFTSAWTGLITVRRLA